LPEGPEESKPITGFSRKPKTMKLTGENGASPEKVNVKYKRKCPNVAEKNSDLLGKSDKYSHKSIFRLQPTCAGMSCDYNLDLIRLRYKL